MPCMKCTSAAVKTAPLGIVTGADMSAIDCWTTGLSAALLDEHAKSAGQNRTAAKLLVVNMCTVVWDQRETIRAGPAVRHGFHLPADFDCAESRVNPVPPSRNSPSATAVAGRHRGAGRG